MARAKRTERSEARRRYRAASTGAPAEGDETPEGAEVPAAAQPRDRRGRRPASAGEPVSATQARPGFIGTLRAAAGPVDIAGDIRAFPSIVMRSRAGWVPALVILATTVAMLIPALASNQMVALAGNVVLQPPPMIIAFLAGMLAPRGAWLMGGLMGLLATVAFIVQYVVGTDTLMTPLGFTVTLLPADKLAVGGAGIPATLMTGLVFGVAVGAFAGFYRRFLNMSQPQRQAKGARKR